jgi:hypothetical protein
MLKQNALSGAAIAQDSIDVNRRHVHSEVALNLHKRLRGPFSPQFIAEQIQGNGIDPGAHPALPTKLMQAFPSANPRCLRQFLSMSGRYSTAHQKTSGSVESRDVRVSIFFPDRLGAFFVQCTGRGRIDGAGRRCG